MDLSLPKKSDDFDSDWEDIDEDDDVEHNSGRNYPLKIRHVCESCENVLLDLMDQGELAPLSHANVCPSCSHKSMHQPYYNICSICVRVLRKCALCCGDYNEDHIDPREVLLTPCLRNVLDVFPDPYQRKLTRFIYKKWESFLEKKDVQIEEFRKEYMTMAYGFINEIETTKKKRDEEKLRLGVDVSAIVSEEMKRIQTELNAMTEEDIAELQRIEQEVNSQLAQSGAMEVIQAQLLKNVEIGESSTMPTFDMNYFEEEEPDPPEPFEIPLSNEELIWNDLHFNVAVNLTNDDKKTDNKTEIGDQKISVQEEVGAKKRHLQEAGDDICTTPKKKKNLANESKKMKSEKGQKDENYAVPGCSGLGNQKQRGRPKGSRGKKHY